MGTYFVEASGDLKCIWTLGGLLVCFRTKFPDPKNNAADFVSLECDYCTCLREIRGRISPGQRCDTEAEEHHARTSSGR